MRPSRPAPASSFWRGDFPRVVGAYFSFFFSNSTFLLLPLYFDSLGAGESLIGALAAASNLATLFAMPGAGLCVRRWGGWSVLLWGLAAQAASALGFLLAPGSRFPLFALLRLVQGAAFALAFTGSVVVAAEAAPKGRRAQAFGLLGVVAPLSQALAPRLGEALVGVGGYPLLFASALAWAVLGAVLSVAARRARSPDRAGKTRPSRPFGGPTFGGPTFGEPSAFALARRRDFRANLFAGFCFGFAFGAVLTFAPLAIRGAGLPAVGFFFTMQGGMVALTRLTLGSLADRFGKRRVILPALALLGASMVLLAAAKAERGFTAGALLMGFSHGLLFPAMMALAVDRVQPEEAGSTVALFGGAFNLGMLVSGFSLGPVAEAFGFAALFGLAGALTWAGFLAFLLGDPRE